MRKKIPLILFLIILNCRGNILCWRHLPNKIFDSKNNFVRIYLPSTLTDTNQKLPFTDYMIAILKKEKDTTFERMLLINPDKGLSFNSLWSGFEQFRYPAGCEISFPISPGKNVYEIRLGGYLNGFITYKIIEIDLHLNQSLRVGIIAKEIPFPNPQTFEERTANSNHEFFQFTISEESSFQESKYEKCKTN